MRDALGDHERGSARDPGAHPVDLGPARAGSADDHDRLAGPLGAMPSMMTRLWEISCVGDQHALGDGLAERPFDDRTRQHAHALAIEAVCEFHTAILPRNIIGSSM